MKYAEHFKILRTGILEACGFKFSQPLPDAESEEYEACSFSLNNKSVLFRQAKITPTKVGQFVTVWKRKANGPIQPYDKSDKVDLVIVAVVAEKRYGYFVFPKAILIQKDVFSTNGKGGKRALRVYPPWDKTESKQAQSTQKWQLEFFIEISKTKPVDLEKAKSLYLA